MPSLPPEDVLPVLVADLADEDARAILEAAAASGKRVYVPLETAPVSAAEHVLEVHVPGAGEPLTFRAKPLGPPTPDGFPLRIVSMDAPPLTAGPAADTGPAVSARADESLTGRSLAGGKLVIEALIGRGGVGAVYKARHRELMMPIAVKVLHESFQKDIDFCRRFHAEALATSRLDHPNITRVLDFGQEPSGQLYFAMEYLDGAPLRAVLDKLRTLPMPRIVEIMVQVCAGLSHAHSRGIIHRDVKPENLVLVPSQDDDGEPIEIVKVCDFGIALHRAVPPTKDGAATLAGTPEYMSPEQCRGDELDARSDVYACGVVLYEMATGQVPFRAERPHVLFDKHRSAPVLPPSKIDPGIDQELEAIILKALAKHPADRWHTMRELRAALRELSASDASPPPSSVRSLPSSARMPARSAADEAADAIARDPVAWMRHLAHVGDERAFMRELDRLEAALRSLAARGDVRTLWSVASTLESMTTQGARTLGSRADAASRSLRALQDPSVLAVVGERVLTGPEDAREHAKRLLVHAGVAGAYGLYSARVKLAGDPAARAPFGIALAELGPRAWPVVRAALEKILATEANSATMELAEDLLLCVPLVGDEQAGHLVAKYLRVDVSGVCRAATAAIVKLWGERSKPLLVGMLQTKEDVVRIAGIAGLRQIGAIDEHVVARLSAMLGRRIAAGDNLRAAAAMALAYATPTARDAALALVVELVTASTSAAALEPPTVVLALARSLLTLGGRSHHAAVAERADRSDEPLRSQLRRLLTS